MSKIYIAGCGGMLGEAFYCCFKNDNNLKCTDIDVNANWLSYLDFRDYVSYRSSVLGFNPDYLFHLGAHTDLEYCELNPDDCFMTNTISVQHAVTIANLHDIPLLYISTAGIFDGQKDSYDDWDAPNPLGMYARSKYAGERYVIEHAKKYLICRAGWMMGGGEKDKKYIGKLQRQINSGAKELFIVDDKYGTPTYTHDFARNVAELIKLNQTGVFNMVCGGMASRMEIAKELVSIVNPKIKVTAVSSDYFTEYWAPRPASERLDNRRLRILGLNKMKDWKTALKEYLCE